ncbi:MAG: VOC family protein [Actinomycetota bacterium]|nr:VOC family protein [Actinomycetota bacterium]
MEVVSGLHQVAQHAEDLDRAIGFYRDVLGARFIARFDAPGLAFFDLQGTRLLLESGVPSAMLYLRVRDIDAAFRTLSERGVVFEEDPRLVYRDDEGLFGPPGEEEWIAAFRDSEGNLVALMSRRIAG